MATLPPTGGSGDVTADSSANAPGSSANKPKTPLALGLGFLKGLGGTEHKVNRDGQPPKRRGPKPDSKPALTRRQELNRQAQRTHRERKEGYIKQLEEQVMHLREVYVGSVQERNAVAEENHKLKELLHRHGIAYPGGGDGGGGFAPHHHQPTPGLTPPPTIPSQSTTPGGPSFPGGASDPSPQPAQPPFGAMAPGDDSSPPPAEADDDYDQLGVDFVLALEAACMDHLNDMLVRSTTSVQATPSGHALMVSCPPPPPYQAQAPVVPASAGAADPAPTRGPHAHAHAHAMTPTPTPTPTHAVAPEARPYRPALPRGDLMRLLLLSQRLPTVDGELTPVTALHAIRSHPRARELDREDWAWVRDELAPKTRCYGFGAVLEEFELRDALHAVFQAKELTGLAGAGMEM